MTLYRDQWAAREAWRKHPVFSQRAMLRNLFPGFGIAVVAFSAYVLADTLLHPTNLDKVREQAHKETQRPEILDLLKGKESKDGSH